MKPSPVQCIRLFCLRCQSQDEWAVGNCLQSECPLWVVRPNQGLQGKQRDQYDLDELAQQVLDNLDFDGLKEMIYDHD